MNLKFVKYTFKIKTFLILQKLLNWTHYNTFVTTDKLVIYLYKTHIDRRINLITFI